ERFVAWQPHVRFIRICDLSYARRQWIATCGVRFRSCDAQRTIGIVRHTVCPPNTTTASTNASGNPRPPPPRELTIHRKKRLNPMGCKTLWKRGESPHESSTGEPLARQQLAKSLQRLLQDLAQGLRVHVIVVQELQHQGRSLPRILHLRLDA